MAVYGEAAVVARGVSRHDVIFAQRGLSVRFQSRKYNIYDMMHSPDCKHTLSCVYREREEAISQARDPYADHPAWLRRNYLRKLH